MDSVAFDPNLSPSFAPAPTANTQNDVPFEPLPLHPYADHNQVVGVGMGDPVPSLAANPTSLGFSLLAVALGAAVGGALRGVGGGIAGALYGGAVVNALRAAKNVTNGDSASDREALVSGTYAVIAGGIATYVLMRSNKATPNAEPSEEDDEDEEPSSSNKLIAVK